MERVGEGYLYGMMHQRGLEAGVFSRAQGGDVCGVRASEWSGMQARIMMADALM